MVHDDRRRAARLPPGERGRARGRVAVAVATVGPITLPDGEDFDPPGLELGAFLVLYEADGEVAWVRQLGTSGATESEGAFLLQLAFESDDTLLVTGAVPTDGGLDFDADLVDDVSTTSGADVFAVRMDADAGIPRVGGVAQFGDGGKQIARAMFRRADGAIYLTGSMCGELNIEDCRVITSSCNDGPIAFVARLTPDLKCERLYAYGATSVLEGLDIHANAEGRMVVVGEYGGSIELPPDQTLFSDTFSSLVVVIEENGVVAWGAEMGQQRKAVAFIDDGGLVRLGGKMAGTPVFDGGTQSAGPDPEGLYLAKLDPTLAPGDMVLWRRSIGGDSDAGGRVEVSPFGLLAVGGFAGAATFGVAGERTSTDEFSDGFVADIDDDTGEVRAVEVIGAESIDGVSRTFQRENGDRIVIGAFWDSMNDVVTEGEQDLYVWRRPPPR